ncbi:MAG: aldose 1-epimerase family protein [Planctomycetia bacterium]|nr:aldose 1-epimerase family protein [Planctomycetia bacterium]
METAKYFTLCASEKLQKVDVHAESTTYRHQEFRDVCVTHKTLRGGPSDGVDLFVLSNGQISVFVMPTRGMGIWKVHLMRNGEKIRVGWNSPVNVPVNPRNVPLMQSDGLGWLRGFNEFVVRCGLESNGSPEYDENGRLQYGLHGFIANTPASQVKLEVDDVRKTVSLTGIVREARLFFNSLELHSRITLPFEGTTFRIDDEVRNIRSRPCEMELLYHINIGNPIADTGAKIHIPYRRVAPRNAFSATQMEELFSYHAPTVGEPETCYYYDLATDESGNTRTFLENPSGEVGVSVAFNQNEFPHFCQWKCQHAREDGYVTGMEPATSFPNNHSFEKANGRVIELPPGEKRHFGLDFRFCITSNEVQEEIAKVAQIQALTPNPIQEKEPDPQWAN